MKVNDAIRLMGGFMVLLGVALAVWVDQRWLWLTAFVGANLLQSAFTKWCPAFWMFRKCGLRD
jgi:hypothetical protein